jgi:Domain of unknown function (DUF4912)/Tetratricopeptide repeat
MQRRDLEGLTREELIARAERLGVSRPRVLTQPELVDEILSRTSKSERERSKARGWLGRARDLLASVVERGLHLPDAARSMRGAGPQRVPAAPPPLPTVTLAEIYAAQGHLDRAVEVLDEVIAREPDHEEARTLRERFNDQRRRGRAAPARPSDTEAPLETSAAPDAAPESAPGDDAAAVEGSSSSEAPLSEVPATVASAKKDETEAPSEAAPPRDAPTEAIVSAGEERAAPAEPSAAAPATGGEAVAAALADADAPLPDRYGVDEIVAIAVDPRSVYLYWEIRPTTLARARARRPDGSLGIRVISVAPSWEGPIVSARDVAVSALFGDLFIRDVEPGSNVRVSVGWLAGAEFEPLAVGAEIAAPRVTPADTLGQSVAQWSPDPIRASPARPLTSPVIQGAALERVRRHTGGAPAGAGAPRGAADRRAAAIDEAYLGTTRAPRPGLSTSAPARIERWVTRPIGASELGRTLTWEERARVERAPGWGGASDLGRGSAGHRARQH